MEFCSIGKFIVCMIFLLSIVQIKAQSGNDLDFTDFGKEVGKLPLIGSFLEDVIKYTGKEVEDSDKITNAIISRIIGDGVLPCKITINGTICSGTPRNGTSAIINAVVDIIPVSVLPQFGKQMTIDVLDAIADPLAREIMNGDIDLM